MKARVYGERWAQHWLDVVRFGESEKFEYNTHLKDAWRFRDYVIRSQNNKPFDRLVIEHIAGDELRPGKDEELVAAGFDRLGPVRRNAGNQETASMNQIARNLTDSVDGLLTKKRYLIHDRDPLFTDEFLSNLKVVGVESVKLLARSPNLPSDSCAVSSNPAWSG